MSALSIIPDSRTPQHALSVSKTQRKNDQKTAAENSTRTEIITSILMLELYHSNLFLFRVSYNVYVHHKTTFCRSSAIAHTVLNNNKVEFSSCHNRFDVGNNSFGRHVLLFIYFVFRIPKNSDFQKCPLYGKILGRFQKTSGTIIELMRHRKPHVSHAFRTFFE